MTVAYFDSSALVKLVVEEEGTADVLALWNGAAAVISSRLAHPEVRAALAAAHRDGRLDLGGHERVKERWHRYRASLRMVELTPNSRRRPANSPSTTHSAGATLYTWPPR